METTGEEEREVRNRDEVVCGVHPRYCTYCDDTDEGQSAAEAQTNVEATLSSGEEGDSLILKRSCTAANALYSRVESVFAGVMEAMGEDLTREGVVKTPKRYAKALGEILQGYSTTPKSVVGDAIFLEDHLTGHDGSGQMVLVHDIEFFSTHRMTLLPFFGVCHVAYLPKKGNVVGLSKLARMVETLAKRLQTPEELVQEVASAMEQILDPRGVLVVGMWSLLTDRRVDGGRIVIERKGEMGAVSANEVLAMLLGSRNGRNGGGCSGCFVSTLDDAMDVTRKSFDGVRDLGRVKRGIFEMYNIAQTVSGFSIPDDVMWSSAETYAKWLVSVTAGKFTPLEHALQAARSTRQPVSGAEIVLKHGTEIFGDSRLVCIDEMLSPVGSVCEHHILPFFGVLYISVARTVDAKNTSVDLDDLRGVIWKYSRQLQLQERLVHQIADSVQSVLPPTDGIMVIMSAYHHCMRARGAEKPAACTTSIVKRGIFETDSAASLACISRFQDLKQK
eukprot:CAMPEP_0198236910 /NCGR_PEP_ID=MMETSP1446-20131203/2803_1 /TAXON_ID=1461542 ORGANISM="Unidentified sp, Strain CCMP2111" /NCGR_SAMPLE_ID=MMETSP1446 /ASSEMBLY_ACC=CAM_ASM_001112 /LENGTH=503 /DNA_ID=CAMNT_0043918887 /DNA_START=171 /DNA_END=1682 /DNA_ORIENTATION=-